MTTQRRRECEDRTERFKAAMLLALAVGGRGRELRDGALGAGKGKKMEMSLFQSLWSQRGFVDTLVSAH